MALYPTNPTDIASMRKPYTGDDDAFEEQDLVSKEPFKNFGSWFNSACQSPSVHEANAMSLATVSADGRPSVRMVLLKGYDTSGFRFFSNFESRKGRELACNPHASLLFYWTNTATDSAFWSRQVRVEGTVEKLSEEESTEYFHSRPRASQIGACISNQSTVIADRQVLMDKQAELEKLHSDHSMLIPKPKYWGGFLLRPEVVEFWQGHTNRVHDRIVFRHKKDEEVIDPSITREGEDGWVYERLSP